MPRARRQSEQPGAAELYERLLAEQGGVCAICMSPPKTRRLHIDHDHGSKAVRGLLCFRCNNALPAWITVRWLLAAAAYLADSSDDMTTAVLREILPSMSVVQAEAAKGVPEPRPRTGGTGSR